MSFRSVGGRAHRRLGRLVFRAEGAGWQRTELDGDGAGKSWFAIVRLYGPLELWFEKSGRPGEIEELR